MQKSNQSHKQYRPEQLLAQLISEQYYNYLSLLRITNNFEKKIQLYQKTDINYYQSKIALIGNISEISSDPNQKNYWYPIVNTPINRYLFINQGIPFSKKPQAPIKRKLVLTNQNYLQTLLLPLNKIITTTKKQKDQFFIFTHLNLYLKDNHELHFALTEQSYIIQLEPQFYKCVLQPLETSLETNFAEINLNLVYNNNHLQKNSTFTITEVRNKINQNINTHPILGQLRKIHTETLEKPVNAKEKEVTLDVIQDVFPYQYYSLGTCRIYVRFDILDEEEMKEHMQQGCIYVFLVNQVILSDNLQLVFKLNHWKGNMLKITQHPTAIVNLQEKYKEMKVGSLSALTYPCIFRNYYKFRVVKTDIKFMYLKVSCEKCDNNLLRVNENEYRCMNQCGIVNGKLKVWTIVGCMDKSTYAEMTLQDQQALIFFDLEAEAHQIKDQTLKEQQDLKKGVTLYFKKPRQNYHEQQFQDGLIYDKNPFLLLILNKCQVNVVEREVVATARSGNDNKNSLEEDTRNEMQVSFVRNRDYLKKSKLFLNGQFRTYYDRTRLVPHIKAERVYPCTTFTA